MQPLGHNRYGPKTGGFAPSGEEELGPDLKQNVARADAYLLAKSHLDPSNYLATAQQRYRHTDRQTNKTGRQRSDSIGRTVFGRPFVKRFALYYRTVVCHVCLSRSKPHYVRWGSAAPKRDRTASPQFSAHVYCAKTVAHLSYC